jgi:hypothetical protein
MNLSQFLETALGIKLKKPTKPRRYVVDHGKTVVHRGERDPVPVKRSYLVNRNAYNPQTCRRPKEALKAAKRALREELKCQSKMGASDGEAAISTES